jgi:hypothetical protein
MEQSPDNNSHHESEHEKALREARERLAPFYAQLDKPARPSTLRIIIDDYIKHAHERDQQLPDDQE